jgi:membrane protein
LVIASFIPMTVATILVAFGNQVEDWMVSHLVTELGPVILALWTLGRWLISMLTSIAVLVLIYHFGLPRWQPWYRVLPGATLATVVWFGSTKVFGWYVTNYATYSLIYGPLGAAIALLVWMYIISLVVLVGAEFNALVYPRAVLTTSDQVAETAPAGRAK